MNKAIALVVRYGQNKRDENPWNVPLKLLNTVILSESTTNNGFINQVILMIRGQLHACYIRLELQLY